MQLQSGSARRGNDSFTKVLLPFDGADASTTITDANVGGSAHTWTAAGNAQLDNGIAPKFGSAALLLDGTGDFVTTPDSTDFTLGSSDFTIDCWFNVAGGSGARRGIGGQGNSGLTSFSWLIELQATNIMRGSVTTNGSTQTSAAGSTAFTSTGWHHVAFVRTGNVLKLFLDGVQEGGDVAFASAVFDSANKLGVGCMGEIATLTWNGSLDQFRMSVGVARWTANFTPPAGPYSRGGKASAPNLALAA
jgi:hypothetical protein